ncbi:hypothetical protein [Pseudoalteromonas denitrificans]|jgi:hypothetical protein|uniref:Uncharacterized protein n=1 Tax=Pseudoalteromonas denitrificans DSM 6059 TaxID=1123010 RepID=A0A1I1IK73_9GAMM|nr:hypothetical protein [Pseudoalteromonas denitrificans]SFC36361.1 hypothetical protein SAMN02745724_01503 [Pseudoalteromonas denitrificans DSM 6059]
MELKLNKKKLKNLSKDKKALPVTITPKVNGAGADAGCGDASSKNRHCGRNGWWEA